MEFKVRAVTDTEEKSVAEREEEVINNAAAESEEQVDDTSAQSNDSDDIEIDEEKVLSFLKKRYDRDINSFEELLEARTTTEEMPEDVEAFLKYKKDTGRGLKDYMKLQEDFDEMNPDRLLRQYFMATEEGLDEEDIDVMMEEFSFDEDVDDESDIKKAKIAKKKAIAKAKSYFNELKEKYKQPVESTAAIPDDEKEEFNAYKQYIAEAKTIQEENERKRQWFQKKTDEVFGEQFKGFEFKIEDKSIVYLPGDAKEVKKAQLTPSTFISKFLDENGLMKDANGYHRALSVAMNPDRFAKFFYEQGVSDATENVTKKIKNINMGDRKAPEVTTKGGVQVRVVSPDDGRGLRIKKR